MDLVEQGGDGEGGIIDFKSGTPTGGQLPLARIKKVMKSDDQVKVPIMTLALHESDC